HKVIRSKGYIEVPIGARDVFCRARRFYQATIHLCHVKKNDQKSLLHTSQQKLSAEMCAL
ncbi:MAG: hypothetical protein RRY38_01460, partial [Oscillospiraceae bacterium]